MNKLHFSEVGKTVCDICRHHSQLGRSNIIGLKDNKLMLDRSLSKTRTSRQWPGFVSINASRSIPTHPSNAKSYGVYWRDSPRCYSLVTLSTPSMRCTRLWMRSNSTKNWRQPPNISELKERRFWATHVNRKWCFFFFGQWFCLNFWTTRLYNGKDT